MRRLARYWKRFCLLLWSLLNTLRLLDRYWKGVCLLLWSLIVEQLTLTDHMLKALIGWIHHTRDDQLDECHCGMPRIWRNRNISTLWYCCRLAISPRLFDVECFLLKSFFWRVSKSFWRLHLYLDPGWRWFYFSISFKYIFSNFVIYWAARSTWGLIITWLFQTQKRNGSEL